MATWPSGSKASTTNLDAGTDKPSLARPDIKQNVDNVNEIIDMFNISGPSDKQLLKYDNGNTRFELTSVVDSVELKDYKETIYALSYAATITPDVANGNVQEITLTGNVTFGGFTSAEDGQSLTLIIHQDGTGSRTFSEGLTSNNAMLFAGADSTLSTAGGSTDIMSIIYAGGIYYASLAKGFA